MAKYQLRDVHSVLLMDLDWDSFAVVLDGDKVLLGVDLHLNHIHCLISLKVVCCVDQNLICKIKNKKVSLLNYAYRRFCRVLGRIESCGR